MLSKVEIKVLNSIIDYEKSCDKVGKIGDSNLTIPELIKITGLNLGQISIVIESLQQEGIIYSVLINKKRYYRITNTYRKRIGMKYVTSVSCPHSFN